MTTRLILPGKISALSILNRVLGGAQYRDARYFILLDENTCEHCLTTLVSRVSALQESEFLEVPVGEEAKSIEIATQLWEALYESGADRDTILVNLGGGCVSDLGGFVAAGYKRGIRYINIPTTLLGMVDASVGGKTALNLGASKNQIGFFHAPVITCVDPLFLDTLPKEQLVGGLFEVYKTQLLNDTFSPRRTTLSAADISDCVQFKTAVVKSDPNDHGIRKILNLGHTFGHAIEGYALQQGKVIQHGVAVGLGLWCELYLSVKKLGLPEQLLTDYRRVLESHMVVPHYTLKDTEPLLELMRHDKKNSDGQIRCVLLQAPGTPVIDVALDENEVRDAILKL